MSRNDSAVSVDSLISSSAGYTNWESEKFGLFLETTLSIHLYVRLNNAVFLIFLLFLRASKTPTQMKNRKSRPGEIQSCFPYECNNLLAFSTSKFKKYAINKKLQQTYHFFFGVASFIFVLLFNTICRIIT